MHLLKHEQKTLRPLRLNTREPLTNLTIVQATKKAHKESSLSVKAL